MKKFEVFASEKFKKEYHYEKPLGAACSPEGTRILLWHLRQKQSSCIFTLREIM